MIYRQPVGRIAAALVLAASFSACLEIEVAAPLLQRVDAVPDPGPAAPRAEIRIVGDNVDDSAWVKALTISRFFYSSVENQSGSLRELLQPALREVLRQKGFRAPLLEQGGAGEYVLQVDVERAILLWLPPREFIQTPKPRARGEVRVDFLFRAVLLDADGRVRYEHEFADERSVTVLPGQEGPSLAKAAEQSLAGFVQALLVELPRLAALRNG